MIDGMASDPFSAVTLPTDSSPINNHEKIIKVSREQYANPRAKVEEKISRWAQVDELSRRTEQSAKDKEIASRLYSEERIKIPNKQFKKEKAKILERGKENKKANFMPNGVADDLAKKNNDISLNEAFKHRAVNFFRKPLIDKPQKLYDSKNIKFKDVKKDELNNLKVSEKVSEIDSDTKPIHLSKGEVVRF